MDLTARLRAAGCVFAEDEALLLHDAPEDLVRRRIAGEPLEHLLGRVEFADLLVHLDPGVFIPRRRTELLAREAVALLAGQPWRPLVVDLCCGSGAVGAVLERAGARVHASDLDPVAVACARRNVARVHRGDLFSGLPSRLRGRVDVVVANAPYVPTGDLDLLPHEARDHEPRLALDGGPDGLAVQRRVAAGARRWLRPVGHLLVETSRRQAPLTADVLSDAGFAARVVTCDDLEATVVVGRQPCRRAA